MELCQPHRIRESFLADPVPDSLQLSELSDAQDGSDNGTPESRAGWMP
jgi:hypothetical protein